MLLGDNVFDVERSDDVSLGQMAVLTQPVGPPVNLFFRRLVCPWNLAATTSLVNSPLSDRLTTPCSD